MAMSLAIKPIGVIMRKLCAGILAAIAVMLLCGYGFAGKDKITLELELTIGGEASDGAGDELASVYDMDVDKDGNIYILEYSLSQVLKYDRNGKFIAKIGRSGQGPGEIPGSPAAIALGPSGEIIVAASSRVVIFDSKGNPRKTLEIGRNIRDMIVDDRGEIVILSLNKGKILQSYTLAGARTDSFGDPLTPSGADAFKDLPAVYLPYFITFTNNGRLCYMNPHKYEIHCYRRNRLDKILKNDSPYFSPVRMKRTEWGAQLQFMGASILESGRRMLVYLKEVDKEDSGHLDIFEDDRRIATIPFNEMPRMIDKQGRLYTTTTVNDYSVIKRYKMAFNQ